MIGFGSNAVVQYCRPAEQRLDAGSRMTPASFDIKAERPESTPCGPSRLRGRGNISRQQQPLASMGVVSLISYSALHHEYESEHGQ